MLGIPAITHPELLHPQACELEEYPETLAHIQRIIKRGIDPINEISSLLHYYMKDQQKVTMPIYYDIIDELRFLQVFFTRKFINLHLAA